MSETMTVRRGLPAGDGATRWSATRRSSCSAPICTCAAAISRQVKGLGERFGRDARARHADLGGRDGGGRRRRRDARHASRRRSQLRRLRDGRDGRDRQPGGQDALHVRRQGAARDPRLLGRRALRRPAHEQRRVLVRGDARASSWRRRRRPPTRAGCSCRRCAATIRWSSSCTSGCRRCAARSTCRSSRSRSARPSVAREGADVTLDHVLVHGAPGARGRRGGRGRRHLGRGDRPAHGRPARPRHDQRVGAQDRPRGAAERRARPSAACSPRSRPASRRRCSTISTRRSSGSAGATPRFRTRRRSSRRSCRRSTASRRRCATSSGWRSDARVRDGCRHLRRPVAGERSGGGPRRRALRGSRHTRGRRARDRRAPTASSSPRTPSAPITSPRSGRACA